MDFSKKIIGFVSLLLSFNVSAEAENENVVDKVEYVRTFTCDVEKALTGEIFKAGEELTVKIDYQSGLFRNNLELIPALLFRINVMKVKGEDISYLVGGTVSSDDAFSQSGTEYTFAESQTFVFPVQNIRNLVTMDNNHIDVRYRGWKGDKQFYIRKGVEEGVWEGKVVVSDIVYNPNDYALVSCKVERDVIKKVNQLNLDFMNKYKGKFVKSD